MGLGLGDHTWGGGGLSTRRHGTIYTPHILRQSLYIKALSRPELPEVRLTQSTSLQCCSDKDSDAWLFGLQSNLARNGTLCMFMHAHVNRKMDRYSDLPICTCIAHT